MNRKSKHDINQHDSYHTKYLLHFHCHLSHYLGGALQSAPTPVKRIEWEITVKDSNDDILILEQRNWWRNGNRTKDKSAKTNEWWQIGEDKWVKSGLIPNFLFCAAEVVVCKERSETLQVQKNNIATAAAASKDNNTPSHPMKKWKGTHQCYFCNVFWLHCKDQMKFSDSIAM